MNVSEDRYILELLPKIAGISSVDAELLHKNWTTNTSKGEHFTDYLVDEKILTAAAPIVLDLMQEGDFRLAESQRLLDENGKANLQKLLQSIRETLPTDPSKNLPSSNSAVPTLQNSVEQTITLKTEIIKVEVGSEAVSKAPAEPTVGGILGKCLLLEKLGEGAMGAVFRALHQTLNISVAVKILHPSLRNDESRLVVFRREARLLARLNHANVIRIWDFSDDSALPYLVLEYVDGLTLAELIQQSGRLRVDRGLAVILQVAEALQAAHSLAIIHRDIKPSNILLTRDGNVKLADLGLACVTHGNLLESLHEPTSGVVGTAAYIAPEQALNQPIDHRADMYSLGATFYHMVTGEIPFRGSSIAAVLQMHVTTPVTPPSRLVPSIPEPVSDLIVRLMAKLPQDRFADYNELIQEIRSLIQSLSLRNHESLNNPNVPSTRPKPTGDSARSGSSFWNLFKSKLSLRKSEGES